LSDTCHNTLTKVLAPAIWNALRSPYTPSPIRGLPNPVSQADWIEIDNIGEVPYRNTHTIH
jgi:hypothetical protein